MTQTSPQTLGSVIDALLHRLGIDRRLKQYSIVDDWPAIVGPQIAQVTSVDRIERNTLVVRVSAAPWRTELSFRKKEILEKVHAAMNSDVIHDIVFR